MVIRRGIMTQVILSLACHPWAEAMHICNLCPSTQVIWVKDQGEDSEKVELIWGGFLKEVVFWARRIEGGKGGNIFLKCAP